VARFGGEEFAIILPRTDTHQAYTLAERIRSLIERHPFYDGSESSRKITVSIGVATYPLDALGKKDLIEKADRALYKAKRVGRNIVVISR
jgi:diguanylate cyclase (GGDEF)-like protein